MAAGMAENTHDRPSLIMQPMDVSGTEVHSEDDSIKLVTPLPRRDMTLIWIIHCSQSFQITMLFPMLVFMVEAYGVSGKQGHATGYYAGLLASLFPLAQFCSSIFWGMISDKAGRRPCLAFGNTISAISSLLLGLSGTYPSACIVRFMGGLLNGSMTITKSTMADLCDGTNQANGFAILSLAWGIGAIAGPVVSGLLAQPCRQYQTENCPLFLQKHPFFLPCFSATLFSSLAVIAAIYLRESKGRCNANKQPYTKISHQNKYVNPGASSSQQHASALREPQLNELKDFYRRTSSTQQQVSALQEPELNGVNDFNGRIFSTQQDESPSHKTHHLKEMKDFYPRSSPAQPHASAPHEPQLTEAKRLQIKSLEEEMTEIHLEPSSSNQAPKQKLIVIISSSKEESLERKPVDSPTDLPDSTRPLSIDQEARRPTNSPKMATLDLLRDRNVLMSSLCYSMAGLAFIITDELFPMFGATAVENGGLGFSSSKLGVILGEAGLVLCLYTLLLYPSVAKRFGPLYCFRYGILCSIPCWILFPTCSLLSATPLLQWALIMFTMAVRSAVACTVFTGVLILVSNSASSDNVGTVTGLSHSFCSFFRATGPALGGMIWSFASTKTFLFHQYLAWLFVLLLSLCTFGLSYALPKSLVYPKDKRVPPYSDKNLE